MLLKLIPTSQEPTIHFSLSFAELPSTLPAPSSWTAQLSHLMHEDLEVPATLHSLDRAAGIPSLLEEVSLDVEMKEIRCRYVDGSVERISFGLRGPKTEQRLVDALTSIVRDVRDSTLEDERVMKAREWERQRTRSASVSVTPSPPLKTGRQGKHKKQRSLFMHIVSCVGSIVNLASPSSSSHPSLPFYSRSNSASSRTSTSNLPGTAIYDSASPNTPPNTPTLPSPGSSPRARALRRAARSALVDTFRQFVLGELVRRFYAGSNTRSGTQHEGGPYTYVYELENHHQRERGGFCVWILHSMRRRALERMEQILEEAGPAPEVQRFSEEVMPGFCATTMDVPLSFSDEEDEEPMVESPVSMKGEDEGYVKFPLDAELDMMEREIEETSTQSISFAADNQAEGYPKRPALSPRRTSSSTSASTDDSSESGSTYRSTSSLSTVSTAPSSVESDVDLKEDIPPAPPAKDVPLSLYQPQYALQHPPGPPIHHLAPATRNEYTQLYDLRTRLGQLVQFAASQSRVAADEVRNRLEVLAVRSRRRAWLNKALRGPLIQKGSAGGSVFGLATPFRSSPLARYVLTADDLIRRRSPISRSACSSTSSLSSSYFRTVSSTSSSPSSVSTPSISKSTSPFPTCRPRIRPRIDYSEALAAAIVDFSGSETLVNDAGVNSTEVNGLTTTTATSWDATDADEEEDAQAAQEFQLSQEVKSPSRARRHHRRTIQEVILPIAPAVPSKPASALLFPVSEEMEHEGDEFTLALSARGRGRGRGKGGFTSTGKRSDGRTFMGCEDVYGEEYSANSSDSEYEDGGADDANPDLEMGLGFDVDMDGVHDNMEMGLNQGATVGNVARPQIRPRVRTTSMMGALLRGAKRSLGGGVKQQQQAALAMDSLLYRPLATPQLQSQPQPQPAAQPKTTPRSHTQSSLMHASNRRAMDLARLPASAIHAKMEIDIVDADVEMNLQLRIDEYEYSAGAPLPLAKSPTHSGPIDVELRPQQYAQDEFTLAMDVPRRGASAHGARRRRDMQSSPRHEAPRRPKLNTVFHGQLAYDGSAC